MFDAGFIGAGNMGGALIGAILRGGASVGAYDRFPEKAAAAGAEVLASDTAAADSRFVFLAVKPAGIRDAAQSVGPCLGPDTVLVTIAAGVALADVCKAAGTQRVIRIMPNTPVSVGEGMVLYCTAPGVSQADEEAFLALMSRAGRLDKIDEKLIDAAAALSGCGPAYVYIFAEALADGAVRCGLPRDKAMLYAKQTLAGAAKLMLESGKHPGELKDAVCSPGGTTIEGVLALEENSFRFAAASAVTAAYDKTAKLK